VLAEQGIYEQVQGEDGWGYGGRGGGQAGSQRISHPKEEDTAGYLLPRYDEGRVYGYLDTQDGATGAGTAAGMSTLVQSLQDQIAYLRREAEDWKEKARRKGTIIMS
jgi:hypothetical protein